MGIQLTGKAVRREVAEESVMGDSYGEHVRQTWREKAAELCMAFVCNSCSLQHSTLSASEGWKGKMEGESVRRKIWSSIQPTTLLTVHVLEGKKWRTELFDPK